MEPTRTEEEEEEKADNDPIWDVVGLMAMEAASIATSTAASSLLLLAAGSAQSATMRNARTQQSRAGAKNERTPSAICVRRRMTERMMSD